MDDCALIEVTAGFHPDLTGRENVYLNGTILGMRTKEINSKFDEIVESQDWEFIDTPVKKVFIGYVLAFGLFGGCPHGPGYSFSG